MVEAICTSGRSVEVVIGVAGSGKTTALDAATSALNRSGYRVVGASTSGQAAQNLGAQAHIEARTITSLLWRLDRRQITLGQRSVVILDEAAMTAARDLHRVVAHVEQARAKLVLVGDPRQLSAIGPGGALAALIERRPEILTTVDINVRQRDPAERQALAELRNGDVDKAVDWYLRRGRTALSPGRADALIGMAEAWAGDIADGHDTALLAWRRDDVRDLNRLARDLHRDQGRVAGPEVVAPGGRPYAAGDQVVLLAPNPAQHLVTSQRLTVTHADLYGDRLHATTDDGRTVVLEGDALDADHLDHGYALTVHRAQGATYDRAHVLADGGGRELAYVALSRARTGTTLRAIADDLPQLQYDLALDWQADRSERWIGADQIELEASADDQPGPEPTEIDRLRNRLDALGSRSRSIEDDVGLGL